jgi:hypothetical protein
MSMVFWDVEEWQGSVEAHRSVSTTAIRLAGGQSPRLAKEVEDGTVNSSVVSPKTERCDSEEVRRGER